MIKTKGIHPGLVLVVVLVFSSFAFLQLNDPDSWLWVVAYAVVAGLWAWGAFRPLSHVLVRAVGLTYGFGAAWFWPGRVDGLTEEMMSAKPHIELARESGGLLVSAVFLLVLARLLRLRAVRAQCHAEDSKGSP